MPNRRTAHIRTSFDWYPTRGDGLVRVSFIELHNDQFRVCVWGEDDYGLERDFPHVERQAAKRLYEQLIACSILTQEFCKSLGMYPA